MGAFRIMLLAGIAILAVGGGSLAQTGPGPSMEDFLKADNDSANWVLPAHNYSANRQVEESEIGPRYGSGHLGAAGDLCIVSSGIFNWRMHWQMNTKVGIRKECVTASLLPKMPSRPSTALLHTKRLSPEKSRDRQ